MGGKVFLGLKNNAISFELSIDWNCKCKTATYNLHIPFASVPDGQRERSLQASVLLLEQDERLVRSLALAIVLGRQADCESILCAEGDWSFERRLRTEAVQDHHQPLLQLGATGAWICGADLFLSASPPFLELMETLPSSKLHEEAAWTAPAASSRREGIPVNRMLPGLLCGKEWRRKCE